MWCLCSFQLNGVCFQAKLDWLWHHDCVLVLHESQLPFVILTKLLLGLSVERPSASIHFFFVPVLSLFSTWHACHNMIPCYCFGFMTTCVSWDLREVLGHAYEFSILCSWSPEACWLLWWRGFKILVVSLCGNKLSCVLFFFRDIRTQDFDVPGCCDGTSTSITKVSADVNTPIPVTGPILTWSLKNRL